MIEPSILDPEQQVVFPELDDLEPLFSDQEEIQPEAPSRILILSPTGTSAQLLSNPSLMDTLSNFPLFGSRAGSPKDPEPLTEDEPPQDANREGGIQNQNPIQTPALTSTTSRRCRQ